MKAIYKILTAAFNVFCVFYFAFVLVISINAAESIKPNSNEECSNNSANKCVLISIIGSSEISKKNKTSIITIQIENTSLNLFL